MNPIRDLTLEANELMDKADQLGGEMTDLTDLEITRLCAEAMVKKFCLSLVRQYGGIENAYQWGVFGSVDTSFARGLPIEAWGVDLNKTICECVARMEKAKHG